MNPYMMLSMSLKLILVKGHQNLTPLKNGLTRRVDLAGWSTWQRQIVNQSLNCSNINEINLDHLI